MFTKTLMTVKKFLKDTAGIADLSNNSTLFTGVAAIVITAGVVTAVAKGTNTLANTSTTATDAAGQRVSAPLGVHGGTTEVAQAVYK